MAKIKHIKTDKASEASKNVVPALIAEEKTVLNNDTIDKELEDSKYDDESLYEKVTKHCIKRFNKYLEEQGYHYSYKIKVFTTYETSITAIEEIAKEANVDSSKVNVKIPLAKLTIDRIELGKVHKLYEIKHYFANAKEFNDESLFKSILFKQLLMDEFINLLTTLEHKKAI